MDPEIVDVRGLGCGSVLIELAARRRSISGPVVVLVWTDDAGAPEELPAWCRMTKQTFTGSVGDVDGAARYRLTLEPLP